MPIHVEDLPELDLAAFRVDPAAALDAVRPHRLVRSPRGVEVIDYGLGYDLLADERLRPMHAEDFASHGASPYIADFIDNGISLYMEPERHLAVRKVFARAFAARKVIDHQAAILETANSLIDGLVSAAAGDVITDFTQRYSAEVLCRLLGIPSLDIPEFVSAALDLRYLVYIPITPHIRTIEDALDTLRAYAGRLIDDRRRRPTGDFLSTLAEAHQGALSTDEVIWSTVNLILAGVDTTNFQLALTLLHLAAHGCWDRVAADAAAREAAIEEAMRLTPLITMLGRLVQRLAVIDDVDLPVGQDVKINLVGAGRDPQRFADPHSYRLDREPPFFPMVFSNGQYTCIGKHLAKEELRAAVGLLTTRLRPLAFSAPPVMHEWTDALYGPISMPATFLAR
jgi:cytochrome P450 family 103